MASSSSFCLTDDWRAEKEGSVFVFPNRSSSSDSGKWHISRKGETSSFCGKYSRVRQPNQVDNKREVPEGSKVGDLKDLIRLGSLCCKCRYGFEKELERGSLW